MAARGKSRVFEKSNGEIVAFNEGAIRNNAIVVEYCRTSMAALGGGTAGILGLTGYLAGFGFYLFCVVILWLLLLLKAGPKWEKYFTSRTSLLTSGLTSGLTTFVLFWTFMYGMVHVY